MGLDIQDTEPGDALLFTITLDGSYSFGGGGTVQLIYDTVGDQGEVIDNAAVSCNTYNDINRGTSCWNSPTSGGSGQAGNSVQFFLPIDGIDSVSLTAMLTTGSGTTGTPSSPSFTDFIHSAHITITVPDDVTLNGNQGGALFVQSGATTAVPEPGSMVLFLGGATGLLGRRWWRLRK